MLAQPATNRSSARKVLLHIRNQENMLMIHSRRWVLGVGWRRGEAICMLQKELVTFAVKKHTQRKKSSLSSLSSHILCQQNIIYGLVTKKSCHAGTRQG